MRSDPRERNLRAIVRGTYDLQKLRIQTGNRIVANFKVKLGIEPGESEDKADKKAKKILKQIRMTFDKITDGCATIPSSRQFRPEGIISEYTELVLIAGYFDLMRHEKVHFESLRKVIHQEPLWRLYLKDVKGCGTAMTGVLLSEIDITKAKYVSSLWKYAGLDVADDGRGRSRRKEHLVEYKYINKDGEEATRQGITFNPFLKSKLTKVLGGCFLKAGAEYAKIYRDYKCRLENHPIYKDVSIGHRHNMAIRYMVKMFLVDLYVNWRGLEGFPVNKSYQEAKLGHVHKEAV